MIKLVRPKKPGELTSKKIKELTRDYKIRKNPVWKKKYITTALSNMSNDKCSYCECRLNVESKYLEIDHFYPKEHYPKLVVTWGNLFPSCKGCNTSKHDLDPKKIEIVNPVNDEPKLELKIIAYRFYGKTVKGSNTIEEIGLNHRNLPLIRFEIGNKVLEEVKKLHDKVSSYYTCKTKTNREKNNIIATLTNIMNEAIPDSDYSATAASVLLNNPEYIEIKSMLKLLGLWDKNFKYLETNINFCKLDFS